MRTNLSVIIKTLRIISACVVTTEDNKEKRKLRPNLFPGYPEIDGFIGPSVLKRHQSVTLKSPQEIPEMIPLCEFTQCVGALLNGVFEKFFTITFTVVTDGNLLTYIPTSAKLEAASHRWLAALSPFSFKLQHRAGKHKHRFHSLSCRPCEKVSTSQEPSASGRTLWSTNGFQSVFMLTKDQTLCPN